MRRHLALLASLVSLVLAALGAGTAVAKDHYVNPFANPAWEAGRTDMGMDWAPLHHLAVLAVGDGVILGSSNHSGWPGGHFIYYQLPPGSHAGGIIYVAEPLSRPARAGTAGAA